MLQKARAQIHLEGSCFPGGVAQKLQNGVSQQPEFSFYFEMSGTITPDKDLFL
jgi:hypothetical protein